MHEIFTSQLRSKRTEVGILHGQYQFLDAGIMLQTALTVRSRQSHYLTGVGTSLIYNHLIGDAIKWFLLTWLYCTPFLAFDNRLLDIVAQLTYCWYRVSPSPPTNDLKTTNKILNLFIIE